MGAERQQSTAYEQLHLFEVKRKEAVRHGAGGDGGTRASAREEPQTPTGLRRDRALTSELMEEICKPENLKRGYRKVKANKGAPGVDGMTVDELREWLNEHEGELLTSLLKGTYQPNAVLGIRIPKPSGGMRQLGIPTVKDRLAQQMILQVLNPILDPTFSESSYGFRPKRSAHQALRKAGEYVADGRDVVVDIDLEKFFDRVNHDVMMSRLRRRIADRRLLKIIHRFLKAGMMANGVKIRRFEGTPQGGPLSPLLANLLLDDLDRELERRGHCFVRYADDCNIYVRSQTAGERVMESVRKFLELKLRLRVNRSKSAVAPVMERKFLGHRILWDGRLGIAPQSLKRAKMRIKRITRRNRGISLERMIRELNEFLAGWVTYFRYAKCRSKLRRLDEWIRRRLRSFRLKQRKRVKPIADFLKQLGVPERNAWMLALSGKGWWRMALSPQANIAMSIQWFQDQGLVNLEQRFDSLQQ